MDPIAVLNPIASQMSVMRSTLLGGLVNTLAYNVNRKAHRVRVFEIGRVYRRDPLQPDGPLQVAGVDQPNRVAALAYGSNDDEQWAAAARDSDFFDIKGDIAVVAAGSAVCDCTASGAASGPQRRNRDRRSARRNHRAVASAPAAAIRATQGADGVRDRSGAAADARVCRGMASWLDFSRCSATFR